MKVLCTAIISPVSGEPTTSSTWLRIDGEYLVVGVLAVPGRRVELQIIDEGGQAPSWWDSAMFMTTDARVPSNWAAQVGDGGAVRLGPRPWLAPDFWENYFDREPTAIKVFDEEFAHMLAED